MCWWLVTYVAVCLVAAGTTIAGTAVMVIGVDVWPMFSALGYVKWYAVSEVAAQDIPCQVHMLKVNASGTCIIVTAKHMIR